MGSVFPLGLRLIYLQRIQYLFFFSEMIPIPFFSEFILWMVCIEVQWAASNLDRRKVKAFWTCSFLFKRVKCQEFTKIKSVRNIQQYLGWFDAPN